MKKQLTIIGLSVTGLIFILLSSGIYAGSTAPDVITMESAGYENRTRGLVEFTHKAHVETYQIGCGDCHHDAEGKPLTDLQECDTVQSCISCHAKPGEMKGKAAAGLSDQEKRAYHANAVHDNCLSCHRQHNRENNTKAAPVTCTNCHPKK